ncbi:MAG: trimethylamine methyltransferase family protein [Proteobacteria bacterium]|nr:trimethylamine methyltransferase family protein [Pseudomonadota bacterium]
MAIKGYTRNFPPLKILSEEQIEQIHTGTLEVLKKTGVRFDSEKALKLFEKKGCTVDYSSNRVRFPEALVEESLRSCPSRFHVRARNHENDMVWGGNTTYFQALSGTRTVDLDTWNPRTPTRKEYYNGITVLDALENVSIIPWYTPWFGFKNIPPVMAMPEGLAARLRNSSKFTCAGYSMGCEVFSIQLAQAADTELRTMMAASPPLTFYDETIDAAYRIIEAGFILLPTSGCVYGGTAPATIAGSLISGNAEIIAGVIFAQLVKPGTRIIVQDFSFPQNMRTGAPAFGSIEISMHQAAFSQIWHWYGVPTDGAVCYPNSKKIDYQSGYEKAIIASIGALSGTNTIWIHGAMYGELAFHPVQAIIDDDIAGMLGRFLEGVDINNETMAKDVIDEVGPIPGHYLNTKHTRKWWKKEQFIPKSADRLTHPEWLKTGKKDCIELAREKYEEICEIHRVNPPLTEHQEQDIEKILKEAREHYRKKGLISDAEWEYYQKDIASTGYPYE